MHDTYIIEYSTHNDYDIEVSDLYPVGNIISSEDKMVSYFGQPVDKDIYLGWNILVNDELSCAIYPQKKGDIDSIQARAWTVFSATSEAVQSISFILDSTIEALVGEEPNPPKKRKKKKKKSKEDRSLAELEEECYDDKS
jgi:hypothetical protein